MFLWLEEPSQPGQPSIQLLEYWASIFLGLLNNLVIYWYAILATKTCWPNLISKIGLDKRGIKDLSVAAVLPAVSVQQAAGQTKWEKKRLKSHHNKWTLMDGCKHQGIFFGTLWSNVAFCLRTLQMEVVKIVANHFELFFNSHNLWKLKWHGYS